VLDVFFKQNLSIQTYLLPPITNSGNVRESRAWQQQWEREGGGGVRRESSCLFAFLISEPHTPLLSHSLASYHHHHCAVVFFFFFADRTLLLLALYVAFPCASTVCQLGAGP
jgi:hypothetical protein